MKRLMTIVTAIGALAITPLLAGCPSFVKATGASFTPAAAPPGKAVVHFFRPPQKIMSDYPLFMSVPESANNCYQLESGGYSTHVVEPGKLTVAGTMLSYKVMSLDLKEGDERYVEIGIKDDDATLAEVPADVAKAKLAGLRGIETCSPEKLKKR